MRQKPKEGEEPKEYSKTSYRNIRAGIQRYLTSPPINRIIDLRTDKKFQAANQVYEGKIKQMKREGKDRTLHKVPIDDQDMSKLYSSGTLSNNNPNSLQNKVFVELAIHFGRRGREGWRELSKSSFEIKKDSSSREYVSLAYQEFDKNHAQDQEKMQVMFENKTSELCPVKSFKLYMSKLHKDCNAFLQRPSANYKKTGIWYINAPLGKHTIASLMKKISLEAETSTIYTNHCLKATAANTLKTAGFATKDIMMVTGHSNAATLDSYTLGPNLKRRAEMSKTLATFGKAPAPSTVTSSSEMLAESAVASIGSFTIHTADDTFQQLVKPIEHQNTIATTINTE